MRRKKKIKRSEVKTARARARVHSPPLRNAIAPPKLVHYVHLPPPATALPPQRSRRSAKARARTHATSENHLCRRRCARGALAVLFHTRARAHARSLVHPAHLINLFFSSLLSASPNSGRPLLPHYKHRALYT